jgi:hypothetical protein
VASKPPRAGIKKSKFKTPTMLSFMESKKTNPQQQPLPQEQKSDEDQTKQKKVKKKSVRRPPSPAPPLGCTNDKRPQKIIKKLRLKTDDDVLDKVEETKQVHTEPVLSPTLSNQLMMPEWPSTPSKPVVELPQVLSSLGLSSELQDKFHAWKLSVYGARCIGKGLWEQLTAFYQFNNNQSNTNYSHLHYDRGKKGSNKGSSHHSKRQKTLLLSPVIVNNMEEHNEDDDVDMLLSADSPEAELARKEAAIAAAQAALESLF